VAIHDLVPATAADDAVYIVMELVDAPSLAEVLERRGALPEERVAAMAAQLLGVLDAAHAIGLVHRDIKPSNIMVLPGGEVKLVDFGIAHAMDDTRLTQYGVLGSTGFIAPELFGGAAPSPAADLWALGVTLFRAVEGRDPFARENTAATLHAILHDDLPPLHSSPPLATVISGLLTRDIADRMTGEQARALLGSTTAAHVPSGPAPARSGRADRHDATTAVRPAAVPPGAPTAPVTRLDGDGWAEQPTTVMEDAVEARCVLLPLKRRLRKLGYLHLFYFIVACFACCFTWISFRGLFPIVLGLSFVTPLNLLIHPFVKRGGYECVARVTTRDMTFEFRGKQWSAQWWQLRRVTMEPASRLYGKPVPEPGLVWIIKAELRSGAESAVPRAFRGALGTSTNILYFPTLELARTELGRLDTALRAYAPSQYQPHDTADGSKPRPSSRTVQPVSDASPGSGSGRRARRCWRACR
jgi:hypothetical protein